MRKVCVAVALAIVLSAPALAAVDLIKGADERGEVIIGSYVPDSAGNQSWVRQYDGRQFSALGLEKLSLLGYNGPFQYNLLARDVTFGDQDVNFGLAYKNLLNAGISTSILTHRLGAVPLVDPWLIGTPAAGVVPLVDLSGTGPFAITRQVTDFNIRLTPSFLGDTRIVTDSWQQSKDGTKEVLFRSREAKAGVIANGVRGVAAIPVDNFTNQATTGVDVPIGNASVINYRFSDTTFAENGGRPASGSKEDFLPLNSLTVPQSDTRASTFKARTRITKRLHFTGSFINKTRDNTAKGLQAPTGISINSTNMALTYLATDALTFTGRYRNLDQNNNTLPVISGGDQTNATLSEKQRSAEIETTYTGIPRAFLKLNYQRLNQDRSPVDGTEVPYIRATSDSRIWKASFRYYPGERFSISSNVVSSNTDSAGYAGIPDSRTSVTANATYLLRDNLAFYGDYNNLNEHNNATLVPLGSIPTPATDAAGQQLREEVAGQNYKNSFSTLTFGTWYAVSSRLTLDFNVARIIMDSSALWIFGFTPGAPQLLPDYVPFNSHNNQAALGATYALSPKLRFHAQLAYSLSEGSSLITSSQYPGKIGPVWTPFNAKDTSVTFGFSRDLSKKNSMSLDVSTSDWTDQINPANNGRFNLVRLAWAHGF